MPTATRERKTSKKRRRKKSAKRAWLTAATADRHVLYERSVQEPEAEVEFIFKVWKQRRRRKPKSIREDFCGTAIAACEWVQHRSDHTAIGLDIDVEVLEVAAHRVQSRLDENARRRVELRRADVLTAKAEPVDTVLAMNFSYFLFKDRDTLRRYFRNVHKGLVKDGMFILDAYGGSEAFAELEEERDCDGFTYVWDQAHYNPINGDVINHIHFRFPDGTEMNKAFSYEWRLWTLPEIQELLVEAGFRNVTVYWEGTDEKTEEGDGNFEPATVGEACEGWIAYIVADA